MHRPVCEQEIRPTSMRAPKMQEVARAIQPPRTKGVRTRRAALVVTIAFSDAHYHLRRAILVLPPPRVPPSEFFVRAGRAFTDKESITGAIGDVRQVNVRIKEKATVFTLEIDSANAKVRCESHFQITQPGWAS
jgi:hypothetical protein